MCETAKSLPRDIWEFSDGSPRVEVKFNDLDVSRAFVSFPTPQSLLGSVPRGPPWQGEGQGNAGLAEFRILPAKEPYLKVTHGMTDTNFAMVAFGMAPPEKAESIWKHFQSNENAFYEVNGLFAPTWVSEKAETYGPEDLNKRAPYKDCVAIARIWRYDALMRRLMRDGEGILRTIGYANELHDRPSGGGVGYFAERYGLGRFQPGDEAQATIPKYAGYPAIYNSFIIQKALLGLDVDVWGTIHIDPCVPANWYEKGFGQEGCGLLADHDLGFTYGENRVEGVDRRSGRKKEGSTASSPCSRS